MKFFKNETKDRIGGTPYHMVQSVLPWFNQPYFIKTEKFHMFDSAVSFFVHISFQCMLEPLLV